MTHPRSAALSAAASSLLPGPSSRRAGRGALESTHVRHGESWLNESPFSGNLLR